MLECIDEIHWKVNGEATAYCFFLDLRKAFDRIRRNFIYEKMNSWGIAEKVIDILKFQYNNTTLHVRINSELAPKIITEIEVPQGDPWSPLNFDCVFNSCFEKLQKLGFCYNIKAEAWVKLSGRTVVPLENRLDVIWAYADDVCICTDNRHDLLCAIEALHLLTDEVHLAANVKKSAVMELHNCLRRRMHKKMRKELDSLSVRKFASKRAFLKRHSKLTETLSVFPYVWGDTPIPVVSEYLYLGAVIRDDGTWTSQSKNVIRKINYAFHRLYPTVTERRLSPCTKMKFVLAIATPLPDFAAEAWTPTAADRNRIQSRLNKIYRRCINCPGGVVCEVMWKFLRCPTVEMNNLYLKKLFHFFTRHDCPEGGHNTFVDRIIEKKKDVKYGMGKFTPKTSYQKFVFSLKDGEFYYSKPGLSRAMDIWQAKEIARTFNVKNCSADIDGKLGPGVPGFIYKYNLKVAKWMNDVYLARRDPLDKSQTWWSPSVNLNTSESSILMQSIGSSSITFGPSIACNACGEPDTLDHCTEKCKMLKVHQKCDIHVILYNKKGMRIHMNRLRRIFKCQM